MFTYTIIYEFHGNLHSWQVEATQKEEALEKFGDYFGANPGREGIRNPLYITRHSATVSRVYSVRKVDVPVYRLNPAKVSSTVTPR